MQHWRGGEMAARLFIVGQRDDYHLFAKELAEMERQYAEDAAVRKAECDVAVRRWLFMRQGHPLKAAHAAAVAAVARAA